MRDTDIGKKICEEMVLEQILDSFAVLSARHLTDEFDGDIPERDPPDFVVELDGRAVGIELAQIRNVSDAWDYYAEGCRLAWQKHESYSRRGIFKIPIVLILHSDNLALYEIQSHLGSFDSATDLEGVGFTEVWAVDLSETYYSPGHPFRQADMFCFKPAKFFGFRRVGEWGRKPFG